MYFEAESEGLKYQVQVNESRSHWRVGMREDGKDWEFFDIRKEDYGFFDDTVSFLFKLLQVRCAGFLLALEQIIFEVLMLRLERDFYVGRFCLSRSGFRIGWFCLSLSELYVGVSCLVLLATVRGGTSFLFPTAKKKQKQRKRLQTPAFR